MKDSIQWKWNIDVKNFYTRLYWEYELYQNEDEYFLSMSSWTIVKDLRWNTQDSSSQAPQNDDKVEIIWTHPDLKSFRNFVCLDTRSREVRNRIEKKKSDFLNLVLRRYRSSAGQECFISFEDELGYLYWFTRLLLPDDVSLDWIEGLENGTAIIRELHVYGQLQKIWEKSDSWTQHTWLWKRLLSFAEKLSKSFGYDQISVISWVWVREYYKNLWFKLVWTYMVKVF